MVNDNADTVAGGPLSSLAWFGLAAVTAALVTLLHELGHYVVGAAFDFPGLTFEPTAVRDAAEAAGVPLWQRGLKSAAGPFVNWSLIVVACLAARRQPAARWAQLLGLVASIRGGLIAVTYLIANAVGRAPSGEGQDEINAAAALQLPVAAVMLVTLSITVVAWWFLVTRLAPGRRLWPIALVVAGAITGFTVYARIGAFMMR